MKPIVLYSTGGSGAVVGNTEKVAGEIASELDCLCVKISKDFDSSTLNLNDYDPVFVGTGIYGGRPNRNMLEYLKKTNLKKPLQFAIFITWAGAFESDKKVFDMLKTVLEAKEQRVLDSFYECYGRARQYSHFDEGISSVGRILLF